VRAVTEDPFVNAALASELESSSPRTLALCNSNQRRRGGGGGGGGGGVVVPPHPPERLLAPSSIVIWHREEREHSERSRSSDISPPEGETRSCIIALPPGRVL